MTEAQPPRPDRPSWLRAAGEANAMEALPAAGLTLLKLGSADGERHGPLATAVVPHALEVLQSGHPVFFVECRGYGSSGSADDLAAATHQDPLLMVHKDEDVVVYTPAIKRLSGRIDPGRVTVDGRL